MKNRKFNDADIAKAKNTYYLSGFSVLDVIKAGHATAPLGYRMSYNERESECERLNKSQSFIRHENRDSHISCTLTAAGADYEQSLFDEQTTAE